MTYIQFPSGTFPADVVLLAAVLLALRVAVTLFVVGLLVYCVDMLLPK